MDEKNHMPRIVSMTGIGVNGFAVEPNLGHTLLGLEDTMAKETRALQIAVRPGPPTDYKKLHPFQGELKSLSEADYLKLRNEIIERKFSFMIHVWEDPEDHKLYILDGHQRLRCVKQMVEVEGFTCPPLPIAIVDAISHKEAYHKLLTATASYGKMTPESLNEYLVKNELNHDEIFAAVTWPDIDPHAYKLEFEEGYGVTQVPTNVDPDHVPEPPVHPTAVKGDLYLLGPHRLLCGDSVAVTDVERLMNGEKADLVFTDPPWNVNYGANKNPAGWSGKNRQIMNDHMEPDDWLAFLNGIAASLALSTKPGCPLYCVMSAQEWPVIDKSLREAGFHWSSTIIWAKDRMVLSRKDYHTQYEPIWYGWNDQGPRLAPLEDRTQTDLWQINRPSVSDLHPTTKPIDLIARAVKNSSKEGGLVLDLFGGSGSTLIAAQATNRRCFAMELDPKYVDVIVRRWEGVTGQKAVRAVEGTG